MKKKINIFKLGSIIFTCAILSLSIGAILVPKLIESKENEVTTIVTPKLKSVSVSTQSDLETNLADTSVTEIVITSCITITSGTTLEGNNKVVRATTTGLNASGVVQSGSTYYIFRTDSGSTVTIYNLTIMGGSASAIYNYGTLYMTNVSITRSGKSSSGGGGIYNNSGTCVLKNCSIYRNIARYGGGFISVGGIIVMDGCSLSENRSLASNGGGGACEVNSSGKLYINNSVISNNTSSEIGGAINNYNSYLYLMNTTVTGNATTGDSTYGGGIGNNSGTLYAVNSIFANNFYVPSSGSVTSSDIGRGGSNYLYNCLYGYFNDASLTGGSSNKTSISNAFASYQTSGILTGTGTM